MHNNSILRDKPCFAKAKHSTLRKSCGSARQTWLSGIKEPITNRYLVSPCKLASLVLGLMSDMDLDRADSHTARYMRGWSIGILRE